MQLVLNIKYVTAVNDFVVSVILWADARVTQYEFVVLNDQNTTSALHKVV